MAEVKTPADIQPAFNEIVFIDDTLTALNVTGVDPSPAESITINRVLQRIQSPDNPDVMITAARFDARALVSRLFVDKRIPVEPDESASIPAWCFEDYNLKVLYRANGKEYLALNAVRQIGENLDLFASGESAILTAHTKQNGRRSIPIYEGFPVGASVMVKSWYELDLSVALKFVVDITTAGTTIAFTTSGEAAGGLILWGDGVVSDITGLNVHSHVFETVGMYEVAVFANRKSIYFSGSSSNAATRTAIKRVTQWGRQIEEMNFYSVSGLTTLPVGPLAENVNSVSFEQTSITTLPARIFENCGANITSLAGFCRRSQVTSIPAGVFDTLVNCTSFANAFESISTGIDSLPVGLFDKTTKVTSFAQTFMDTVLRSSLPDGLFKRCPDVTTFDRVFYRSDVPGTIPADTFTGCAKVTTFYGAFGRMQAATIPATLFNDCVSVTNFGSTFAAASNLTTIPADLFRYNTRAIDFSYTFSACSKVTSIPAGLFRYNTEVTTFYGTFSTMPLVTSIPTDLFRYNTKVTNFTDTFSSWRGLTSIPTDLFRYNTEVTLFVRTFRNTTALPTLPTGIFRYNTRAQNFSYCFESSGVTTIPSDLMDGPKNSVTTVEYMFNSCTKLLSVPAYLFRNCALLIYANNVFEYCTAVTSIGIGVFEGCTSLQSIMTGFAGCTALTTLYGDVCPGCTSLITARSAFYNCPITAIPVDMFRDCKLLNDCYQTFFANSTASTTGTTPVSPEGYKIWERAGKSGYPTTITGTQCFRYRINLSDYADIPAVWK